MRRLTLIATLLTTVVGVAFLTSGVGLGTSATGTSTMDAELAAARHDPVFPPSIDATNDVQRPLPIQARPTTTTTTAPPPTTTTTVPPTTTTAPPPPPPTTTTTAPPPPPPPPASAGIVCPAPGSTFTDTWGAARSGGRSHKGVDMLAPTGTPTLAPVSGQVEHRGSSLGGLSWYLYGDDGNTYFGTHLSGYANQGTGWVAAGTVIGYVGDTGNAAGTPHLHFEVHPGGGSPVNPYGRVAAAC